MGYGGDVTTSSTLAVPASLIFLEF